MSDLNLSGCYDTLKSVSEVSNENTINRIRKTKDDLLYDSINQLHLYDIIVTGAGEYIVVPSFDGKSYVAVTWGFLGSYNISHDIVPIENLLSGPHGVYRFPNEFLFHEYIDHVDSVRLYSEASYLNI